VWVKGRFGQDTFYYGRGAGPLPTGVAVVSDLMRVARELRSGSAQRVPPFAHVELEPARILPLAALQQPWYLRFRVHDRPGIIASLAAILARHDVSVDAVLQLPAANKSDLPFVITVETTSEAAIRAALAEMSALDFMATPPVALPMEGNL
jgi:homoserine dehydrogenase